LLVKEDTHKALLGIEKKPSKMEDDEWNDIDFAKATVIVCLSNEVLYNVMNEEIIAGLWCRLESLYMTKSLSNKLFMKKQFYNLQMKEGKPILKYLNVFNRILSNLLALEVKLKEEDKALLLLFSLSYDHLATTIMYDKETLELEDVKQMLQNNELIKKTDSTEEASGLVVKGYERSKSRGPKKDPKAFSSFACYYRKKLGHIKKNCMKYKEMLKKKGGKDSDGASTSGNLDQAGVVEQADENPYDVLTAQSGKGKYSDA